MPALIRNVVFSVLVLLVSVTAGSVAFAYPADSSWFPRVLSVFLALMAIVLMISSRGSTDAEDASLYRSQASQLNYAALVIVAAVLYAIAIQFLSFEIANFLFLIAAMYVLGQRNPIVIAGVATVTMLLVKLLFFVLLDVSRPQGLLF